MTEQLYLDDFKVGQRFISESFGKGGEISWPNPAHATDTLHVESEILEIKPSLRRPAWGTIKIQSVTLNQEQRIVQKLIAEVMLQRKT